MSHLPVLPLLLPLVSSFILLFARGTGLALQRKLNVVFTLALLLLNVIVLRSSFSEAYQVYLLGNWTAPFGIVMVLDKFAALMLILTAVLALAALIYAISEKTDEAGQHFHVLFQLQLFGLNGAFLTGDLFNLFVFFEVLLLASYGLLLHGGGRLRTKGGLHYVVINLIGSSLFLFAVGTLYGLLGTLNMADLAAKMAELPAENYNIVAAAALLLLVVFGIKAALFPLYLWLPGAYANTSAPVAALFAIMTKVGIYAIIRVHGTLFSDMAGPLAGLHMDILFWFGLITLVLAAFGVTSARGLKEQVAYLILASVATLLIGTGLNSVQAQAATLYYLLHSTVVGGAMFLLADIISKGRGLTADRLRSASDVPMPILTGSLFLVAAIAITGMPPLSGFIGKFMILDAALTHPQASWAFAIILISSLLLIVAMARSGSILFYQVVQDQEQAGERVKPLAYASFMGLLLLSPLMVIFAQPIANLTNVIAMQLAEPSGYIQAVLSQAASTGGQ